MSDFIPRADGSIEWQCEHGVGHPVWAPDMEDDTWGIHGCCGHGCCKNAPKSGWPKEWEDTNRMSALYIYRKLQSICNGGE